MDTLAHEVGTSARTISLPVVLPKDLLDRVGVAAPCSAEWDEMVGDDKTRHCAMCKLNVHNLSAMGREEAEAFVRESVKVQADGGRVCVRFYRRADGTILTQDCPVGLAARMRRRARAVVVAAVAIAGMTVAAVASGMGIGRSRWLATGSLGNARPFSDVRKLIRGVPPPRVPVRIQAQGAMAYVPPPVLVPPVGTAGNPPKFKRPVDSAMRGGLSVRLGDINLPNGGGGGVVDPTLAPHTPAGGEP